MKKQLIFFFFLICLTNECLGWRTFARGRSKYGLPPPKITKKIDSPKELWFNQILDHFNPTNTKTWNQRYYVQTKYYKRGGPIFLMIGGEGEASPKWMVQGQWLTYAKENGALCFQLEHRYYGKSRPTPDLSTKNLIYLTSQQALADLAYFIYNTTYEYQIPANSKWITFGGSYPGSLAAWMRYKYPHLVHGAVSTSGPLLAKLDFLEYYAVVENSLKTHSEECVDAVSSAFNRIEVMLHHKDSQLNLTNKFNLCDKIHPSLTQPEDIANFYETLASNFAEVVQYNKDNRESSKTSNITIDVVCDILVDETKGSTVDRLAEVSNLLLKANNETCLDYNYKKMINQLTNVSWEAETSEGGRQWFYQTCTEFGFFQTSTSKPEIFGQRFPVEFFVQQCVDVFGPKYNYEFLQEIIQRTNIIYGGLHLQASNVVYVHGSIDPWHALGITKSSNPEAPAIYINGTAHCANMYPSSPSDSPQLIEARKIVGKLLSKWLI